MAHLGREAAGWAAYSPSSAPAQQFNNPVHCVEIARDGLVHVCDRIQVFAEDGTFVREFFNDKNTLANSSVWKLDLRPDANETYLLNAEVMGQFAIRPAQGRTP